MHIEASKRGEVLCLLQLEAVKPSGFFLEYLSLLGRYGHNVRAPTAANHGSPEHCSSNISTRVISIWYRMQLRSCMRLVSNTYNCIIPSNVRRIKPCFCPASRAHQRRINTVIYRWEQIRISDVGA